MHLKWVFSFVFIAAFLRHYEREHLRVFGNKRHDSDAHFHPFVVSTITEHCHCILDGCEEGQGNELC